MPNMSTNLEYLPESNEQYGTQEYWEKRYVQEGVDVHFDWFMAPTYLLPFLEELMTARRHDTRILHLGCGNSKLGEVLFDAGYKHVVNMDYAPSVIEQMKQKRPDMDWRTMDVMDLAAQQGDYDIVLDKGVMDSFITSKGDVWNPPESDQAKCRKEVEEAIRVLSTRPGSRFIYATFGQPHFRKRYMEGFPGFRLTYRDIGPPEGFSYFLYDLVWVGEGAV